MNQGIDGKRQRRPGLTAHAFHPFGNHVAVTPDTHIQFGLVIGDNSFHLYFSPGHIESAPFVDHIHRQQRAIPLGFSHRRKGAGEGKQDADLYFVGIGRQGVAGT